MHRNAADTIVVGGVVRTLDQADSVASAVALKDGRIIAIGDDSHVAEFRDGTTDVIDAAGRAVFPGFIDGHQHFSVGAIARQLLIYWEDGRYPKSIPDAMADVKARAEQTSSGKWVRAAGLSMTHLDERRFPTRWEIDAVAPDNPVMLASLGNHAVCANSIALQLAGIDRNTLDPPGGSIERDEDGEPTGVLLEMAKMRLDYHSPDNVLEDFSIDQRIDALKKTIPDLHEVGITSIHDIVVDPLEVESWITMRRNGELPVRVRMLIRGIESRTPYEHLLGLGLSSELGDEWLRFGGVKLSIDGICAYRKAAVYEPFPGEPDNFGVVRIPQEELDECIARCHHHGIQMVVHAVGPRAVDMAIDAYEKAFEGRPAPERRHRIEHVHLPRVPGQLERIRYLGIIISTQPALVYKLGEAWVDIWGEEAMAGILPLRSMHELGIPVMGSSDYPSYFNPFFIMKSALVRKTNAGRLLDLSEGLTLDEAIRLHTTTPAFASFEEGIKGSLEVGKVGDLVITSENPYDVPPEALDEIKIDLTMVGGDVVHTR